jgi:hypothetical protein
MVPFPEADRATFFTCSAEIPETVETPSDAEGAVGWLLEALFEDTVRDGPFGRLFVTLAATFGILVSEDVSGWDPVVSFFVALGGEGIKVPSVDIDCTASKRLNALVECPRKIASYLRRFRNVWQSDYTGKLADEEGVDGEQSTISQTGIDREDSSR